MAFEGNDTSLRKSSRISSRLYEVSSSGGIPAGSAEVMKSSMTKGIVRQGFEASSASVTAWNRLSQPCQFLHRYSFKAQSKDLPTMKNQPNTPSQTSCAPDRSTTRTTNVLKAAAGTASRSF